MKRLMRVGVALGSNLGDRIEHLRSGFRWLGTISMEPVLYSHVYETAPIGCPQGSPFFLNAVCELATDKDVFELFQQMRDFERQRGRPVVYAKNASRPLDLDLLYAGDLVVETEELTLPHPRMCERRFVLQPLCDIRPDLALTGQTCAVSKLLASLKDDGQVQIYHEVLK